MDAKIDIVSVVFSDEIELLRLQARSIAKHVSADLVGHIIVIVNDIAEEFVKDAVNQMRHEYGRLADKLRIYTPEQLLSRPFRLSYWRRRNRLMQEGGDQYGWRGYAGWHVQQFLKLLSVRAAKSEYVVILDAKNWLMRPVSLSDFIDETGRPRTYWKIPSERHFTWIKGSFAALGFDEPSDQISATPSKTPLVFERRWMLSAVRFIERKLGPLDLYFLQAKQRKASEFTLLFAVAEVRSGGSSNVFSDGLEEPLTVFTIVASDRVEEYIDKVTAGEASFFGIHRRRFNQLTATEKARLCEMLTAFELVKDDSEARSILTELAARADVLQERGARVSAKVSDL